MFRKAFSRAHADPAPNADFAAYQVLRLAKAHLPGRATGDTLRLEKIPSNPDKPWSSTVFRIVGATGCVAFCKCAHGADARHRMAHEVTAAGRAAERLTHHPGCVAPRILHHDKRRAMMLMTPLQGATLGARLREVGADRVRRADFLERTGRILAAYHGTLALPAPLASAVQLERLRSPARSASASPAFAAICNRLDALKDVLLAPSHIRGHFHGDMNCANILVGRDGEVGLVDFERAGTGVLYPEIATLLIRVLCVAPETGTPKGAGMIPDDDLAAFETGYGLIRGPGFDAACLLSLARMFVRSKLLETGAQLTSHQARRRHRLIDIAARVTE